MKFIVELENNLGYNTPNIIVNGTKCDLILGKSGGWRVVGVYGDYIVKCDFKECRDIYCTQTEAEIDFYCRLDEEDKRFFPELIDFGTYTDEFGTHAWIVQEKVEFAQIRIGYDFFCEWRDMVQKYNIGDMRCRIGAYTTDNNNFSARTDGSLVIFDIGFLDNGWLNAGGILDSQNYAHDRWEPMAA